MNQISDGRSINNSLIRSMHQMLLFFGMNQISKCYEDMKGVFSEVTGSKHAIALLDAIFTNPIFRNRQISKSMKVPSTTVNRFIKALLDDERRLLRVVREAAGRRAAIYSFEPLLEIIRV